MTDVEINNQQLQCI